MNKILIILGTIVAFGVFWMYQSNQPKDFKAGGLDYSFNSATSSISNLATTTLINPYTWTQLKYSGNKGVGMAQFCTDTNVTASNPIYLAFGATSTKPFGSAIINGTPPCYRMTQTDNNMFYGTVYGIASSATSTLMESFK